MSCGESCREKRRNLPRIPLTYCVFIRTCASFGMLNAFEDHGESFTIHGLSQLGKTRLKGSSSRMPTLLLYAGYRLARVMAEYLVKLMFNR